MSAPIIKCVTVRSCCTGAPSILGAQAIPALKNLEILRVYTHRACLNLFRPAGTVGMERDYSWPFVPFQAVCVHTDSQQYVIPKYGRYYLLTKQSTPGAPTESNLLHLPLVGPSVNVFCETMGMKLSTRWVHIQMVEVYFILRVRYYTGHI